MLKRLLLAAAAIAALALVYASVAAAQGPPGPFYDNNNAWACEGEADLPLNHCLNVRSQGDTLVLKVFSPDPRWPVESASTNPKSDLRPCPHDPDADPDGTWWEFAQNLWVCHHRP